MYSNLIIFLCYFVTIHPLLIYLQIYPLQQHNILTTGI
jgi:hypothetical protein